MHAWLQLPEPPGTFTGPEATGHMPLAAIFFEARSRYQHTERRNKERKVPRFAVIAGRLAGRTCLEFPRRVYSRVVGAGGGTGFAEFVSREKIQSPNCRCLFVERKAVAIKRIWREGGCFF